MKTVETRLALIHDAANRVLLITSDKWKGYGLPGGKPEYASEPEVETVKREVLGETGLEISDIVKAEEIVLPPTSQIDGSTTFIVKTYFARADNTTVILNEEVKSWGLFSLDDALLLPLLPPIRKTVEAYIRYCKLKQT